MINRPDQRTVDFYLHSLQIMDEAQIPYVVAGGYAMKTYTGVERHTKDMDLFIRPQHRDAVLKAFEWSGYRTEITWPHFLAKAIHGDVFTDFIYSSANGLCPVDDDFFRFARRGEVLGREVSLCPPEEMIWSKAFVQDRDRFDGADIAHLFRALAPNLNWDRLLKRFEGHEGVLLAHMFLFQYSYPNERYRIPQRILHTLIDRAEHQPPPDDKVCRGTFLSKDQYKSDIEAWGYQDARLQPEGPLTQEQIRTIPVA